MTATKKETLQSSVFLDWARNTNCPKWERMHISMIKRPPCLHWEVPTSSIFRKLKYSKSTSRLLSTLAAHKIRIASLIININSIPI
jgi:hypothetical protein